MAGILGFIDLQQIRQSLGLSGVHVPSRAEVEQIRRERFSGPPTTQSAMPDQGAIAKAVTASKTVPMSMFYRKSGYSVGDLVFDLVLSEDHAFTSTVSAHPVETGADITDHIQKQLQAGKLKGLISNHSIRAGAGSLDRIDRGAWAGAAGAGRAGAAWEVCRKIWETQQPVTIVTGLDTYKDVAIKNITTSRDAETGDALEIEVSFQQIRRVSLKVIRAQAVVAPKNMNSPINRQVAVTQVQGKVLGAEVVMDLGETRITGVVR